MTDALALPDPEHAALSVIRTQCRAIFDHRDEVIGVWDIQTANTHRRQAGAIEQFVGNREGRDDARRAARVLECAVGAALGPSDGRGRPEKNSLASEFLAVPADDRYRFRLMYQHRDIWEPVLLERGLSRAQVLRLIEVKQGRIDVVWPEGRYGVILADPPWQPDAGVLDPSRQIENQYPTLDLDGLVALRDRVDGIALPDCVLLMWTTAQKIAEAVAVIDAWGFTVKSGAVWVKPSIGMGYWFRQRHELLILATRGNPETPLEADRPDSVITADRRGHSEKPDEVYALIEGMFPGVPKAEIFARAERTGWAHGTNETVLRPA